MADAGGRQLLERIDAVGRFLHVLVGTAALEIARPQQVQVLRASILGLDRITLDEAAKANEKIMGFTFLMAAEKDDLLQAIVGKAAAAVPLEPAGAEAVRRVLQDYTALHSYFPASLWEVLQSAEVTASSKLERCLIHCGNLGLRNPSEGSMQILTAVYMLCHDGQASFERMAPALRMQTCKAIKAEFKRMCTHLPPPPVRLQNLPCDPNALKVSAPTLWALAFPDEGPAPSKFSVAVLQCAVACIPMRLSRSDSVPGRASSSQQAAPDVGSGLVMGNVLQQFAMGMAQQFSMLQQSQQQMMTAMGLAPASALPEQTTGSPPSKLLMIGDAASAESRFLRRAQSRIALTESAGSSPAASQPVPQVVPAFPAAAKTTELEEPAPAEQDQSGKQRKSVEEASAAMIAAMDKKQAAKDSRAQASKTQAKGAKPKAAAKLKEEKVQVKSAKAKTDTVKSEPDKGTKRKVQDKDAEERPKNPQVGHESSRNQFMCRTGFKGKGQNVAFQYDPKKKGSMEAARAKADKWVAAEKQKRGIA